MPRVSGMKWLPPSVLGAAALLLAFRWSNLPARWIVHWGPGGHADGWATKTTLGVFGPLLIGLALWIAFELIALAARRASPSSASSFTVLPVRLVATSVALVLAAVAVWLPMAQPTSPIGFIVFTVFVTGAALVAGIVISTRAAKRAVVAGSSGVSDEGWHGLFYRNPSDPRLWVPKRFGIGWTLNFAHRSAWLLLFVLVVPMIVAVIARIATTSR